LVIGTFFRWLDSLGSGSASFVGALTAFAFGIIALVLGALLNYSLNRRRDSIALSQEANSVAAALYSEIVLLRNELARAANVAALIDMGHSYTKSFDMLYVEENPISEPRLYEALSGKLGMLPAIEVLEIAEFHSRVRTVKWWMPKLQEEEGRRYSYSVLHVLKPTRDAVLEIVPTLRAIETRLGIEPPAKDPDIEDTLEAIYREEETMRLNDLENA
jgi:hypothetical protein